MSLTGKYNCRSSETLKRRGYDDEGTPFAPCGVLCKANGYDKEKKECLTCPLAVPDPIKDCKYLENECGYSTHMSIKAHPRLISEIPRCSDRWKKVRNFRSASERSNGTCKSDLDILESPRIYGSAMASIEATSLVCTSITCYHEKLFFISSAP